MLGDAHQLRQVLANLLRNAIVHTPAGTPIDVVVSRATATSRASRSATTGRGCPTDDPDALFERFWRAEGGRERGRAGAGLGLAIVAGIVDAHDGPRQRRATRTAAAPRSSSQLPALRLVSASSQAPPTELTRRGRRWGHDSARPPPPPRRGRPRARRRDRRAGLQRGGRARAQRPPPAPLPRRPSSRSRWRIVIADNASTDATPAIAARLAGRAARRRRCCGSSARAAAARCAPPGRRSEARVVAYMDVDLSTDLRGLLPLVAPLLSGHSDLAIGTRLAHGARVVRGPKRELISRGYNRDPARGPARPLQRRPVRLQGRPHGGAARRPARRRSATTAGSSTPSCSCSPSGAGCGSTRCRSTGSTTPTRACRSCAPRSTTCAASRAWPPPRRWPASSAIGVVQHARLRAALPAAARPARAPPAPTPPRSRSPRSATPPPTAGFTFGLRGRDDVVRHHLRGARGLRAHAGAVQRRAGRAARHRRHAAARASSWPCWCSAACCATVTRYVALKTWVFARRGAVSPSPADPRRRSRA